MTLETRFHWTVQSDIESNDALVYFLAQENPLDLPDSIPTDIRVALKQMSERGQWSAKTGEVSVLPTYGMMKPIALCVAGLGEHADIRSVRESAALVVKALAKRKLSNITLCFSGINPSNPPAKDNQSGWIDWMCAVREGWELGHYQMHSYAREAKAPFTFKEVTLVMEALRDSDSIVLEDAGKRWEQTASITRAVRRARDLVNKPGNLLVPEGIAQAAEQLAATYSSLSVDVLRETELKDKQMGALLAVGQGSIHPPRMIVIRYQGNSNSDQWPTIVGKGITFDTGGISLKQAKGMEEMIGDMGGAAAVLGVMEAIAAIKPTINVMGVIATAENMPSGTAYKPGDVITSYSKRTIEILNTDAEGRVVLADAISYAKELGATQLIDLATLTGAILIALGHEATGAVTNDQTLLQELCLASDFTGEPIWQLPVYKAYKEMLRSEVADVKNATGPHAGSITAGLFLGTFAETTPWVHLDIAGTSWLDKPSGVHPKGGTGVMVRTLVQWLVNRP